MRKVIYQYWIQREWIYLEGEGPAGFTQRKEKEGTNKWSDPMSGYFHTWGTESREMAEDVLIDTVAIIEDVMTGKTYKVDPSKMRFVQPPELRKHKAEIIGDHIIEPEHMKYLMAGLEMEQKAIDLLTSIDSKLKSI